MYPSLSRIYWNNGLFFYVSFMDNWLRNPPPLPLIIYGSEHNPMFVLNLLKLINRLWFPKTDSLCAGFYYLSLLWQRNQQLLWPVFSQSQSIDLGKAFDTVLKFFWNVYDNWCFKPGVISSNLFILLSGFFTL